jgi:hypothetical protein
MHKPTDADLDQFLALRTDRAMTLTNANGNRVLSGNARLV